MSHSEENYININGVSHTYKSGTHALDNINLEIGVGLFWYAGLQRRRQKHFNENSLYSS